MYYEAGDLFFGKGASFMDFTQLQYFKTTAHMGSVSRAAATLFVTQSTLSKSITSLERTLNTRLFDRVGNSIQLNEAGRVFLGYVEQILDLSNEAQQAIQQTDDLETGTVVYSVPSGGILMDLETTFLREHPNVHLKQRMLNAEQALAALQNRELDFAFSFQRIQAPGIEWRKIRDVGFVAIVSVNNPLAGRSGISLIDLKDEKFFANNINSDNSQFLTSMFKKAGFLPDMLYEGDDLLMSIRFIESYGAVSVSTDMDCCSDLQRLFYTGLSGEPSICKIPITDEVAHVDFGVARLQGHYLNRTAAAFYDHIVQGLLDAMKQE